MHGGMNMVVIVLFFVSLLSALMSMLILQGRGISGRRARVLKNWHRISGYVFSLMFLAAVWGMWERLPMVRPGGCITVIHLTLAVLLAAVLVVKVGVARWCKRLYAKLTYMGLAVFFVSVPLVVSPLLIPNAPGSVAAAANTRIEETDDLNMELVLKDRCARCHTLEKVHEQEMDLPQWRETIARMQGYVEDPQFLTIKEADRLARYLAGGKSLRK